MSYIDSIKIKDEVLVWERNNKSERKLKIYKAPYYFYYSDVNGKYTNLYGKPVSKVSYDTGFEFSKNKKEYKENGRVLYESDIPPELKVLSKFYYNKPAPKLNVLFLDIEVDYDKKIGYSSIENPYAPINSIAMYSRWNKTAVLITIPPKEYTGSTNESTILKKLNEIAEIDSNINVDIILCDNERELLNNFIEYIEDSDVLCGWNSKFYDFPMIAKRLEKISKKKIHKLTFPEAPAPTFVTEEFMKREQIVLNVTGRVMLDYLDLFKKYELGGKQSYKLESIADEYLPELPKLSYDGNLADLYREDFLYFIRYNLRDTEILEGLEAKLGYVELANQMVHLSTGLFKHATGTLKLSELATINYCHHELDGLIVNDIKVSRNYSNESDEGSEDEDTIKGALVLIPQIGKHDMIGSIDITSLYPSVIRSLNISPEKVKGQFVENELVIDEFLNETDKPLTLILENGDSAIKPAKKWKTFFLENKMAVSGYGTVFHQDAIGIMPSILSDWFTKRKEYQKKSKELKNIDNEQSDYYDRIQYVYKIKLNSFYGALANKYFRFYDLRLGESTTSCGRLILLHQCAQVEKVLNGKYLLPNITKADDEGKEHYGYTSDCSVIYGDTDSTYFKTHGENEDEAILIADTVGKLVNKTFPAYMRKTFLCTGSFDDKIKTSREIVSDRGIFVDKKRYILHLVNLDGNAVDKLKIMGLETKKTTIPKEIATKINQWMERYLKGEEWDDIEQDVVDYKDMLAQCNNLDLLGLPKGINKLEFYTNEYNIDNDTRLPGHVAAGILYNKCLDIYNDKTSDKITSGMKIRVYYIKNKYERFTSIALPVDLKVIPNWFYEFNIDIDKHIERLIDKPLGNMIKAIGRKPPTKQLLMNKTLIEF